uniref:Uncharacterized protein n=1 Tax=Rhizophora mucronata TaxID=61149 RepID=A0A2P2JR76_RHIMU
MQTTTSKLSKPEIAAGQIGSSEIEMVSTVANLQEQLKTTPV